ncbi:MAG: hypothetical protein U9Q80_00110 [Bacillota bacterium]|nr:hypothetical protein [Bacillota bacterium]
MILTKKIIFKANKTESIVLRLLSFASTRLSQDRGLIGFSGEWLMSLESRILGPTTSGRRLGTICTRRQRML